MRATVVDETASYLKILLLNNVAIGFPISAEHGDLLNTQIERLKKA